MTPLEARIVVRRKVTWLCLPLRGVSHVAAEVDRERKIVRLVLGVPHMKVHWGSRLSFGGMLRALGIELEKGVYVCKCWREGNNIIVDLREVRRVS